MVEIGALVIPNLIIEPAAIRIVGIASTNEKKGF